jgi:lycopene cyclase domain-containing protein
MTYLLIDILVVLIPLIYSFHKRIQFNHLFKPFFIALILTATLYIVWDIEFVKMGVWGFNKDYLVGLDLFYLPVEEWLFFICIPFSCVFTYYAISKLNPAFSLKTRVTKAVNFILVVGLVALLFFNIGKAYTFINAIVTLLILVVVILFKPKIMNNYYLIFLIILIPFFFVNGLLTGSFLESEVVWYNNEENLNFRIGTIPVEDILYAFGLILLPIFLTEIFREKILKS